MEEHPLQMSLFPYFRSYGTNDIEGICRSHLNSLLELQTQEENALTSFSAEVIFCQKQGYWDWELNNTKKILDYYTKNGLLDKFKIHMNNEDKIGYRIKKEKLEEIRVYCQGNSKNTEKPETEPSKKDIVLATPANFR